MKRRVVGIALFCLILLAAIFAGYWDMLNTEKTRIAHEEDEAARSETVAAAASEPKPVSEAPKPAAPAPADASPDAPETAASTPTFDILRVEPDGSTVMAGRAEAGTTVRLTDGATVLGQEKAGPGGDFAIVLDKPLPVGEHEIRIEATGADGAAAISRETAIVSVPEPGREGDLLAFVETPDRPSRLISVPKGETMTKEEPSASAIEPASDEPEAGMSQSEEPTAPPTAAEAAAAPAAETAPDEASDAASSKVPEPPSAAAPPGTAATPPAGTTDIAAAQSVVPAMPPSSSPGPAPAAAPSPATAGARSNLVTPSELAVEAVEIEDRTIYVAGRAPAGQTIRIYVDNVFLAEDAGRKTDRFLVSKSFDVAAGEHMVRADQVASDGMVVARVEVPFLKPEGRNMAAVAGAGGETDGAAQTPATGASPTSGASASTGGEAGAGVPSVTTGAASGVASVANDPRPEVPAAGEGSAPGADTSGRQASASLSGGRSPGSSGPAASRPAGDATSEVASSGSDRSSALSSAGPAGAIGAGEPPAGAEMAAARQAPLKATGARVIIRRGDTLWRISRQAYGRGARYTTIYLANGDQIRDPDRIYPGQVFRMPETATE